MFRILFRSSNLIGYLFKIFLNEEEEEEERRAFRTNFRTESFVVLSLLRPCSLPRSCRLERLARFPRISKIQSTITRWLNVIITTRTILTVLNNPTPPSSAYLKQLLSTKPFPTIIGYGRKSGKIAIEKIKRSSAKESETKLNNFSIKFLHISCEISRIFLNTMANVTQNLRMIRDIFKNKFLSVRTIHISANDIYKLRRIFPKSNSVVASPTRKIEQKIKESKTWNISTFF